MSVIQYPRIYADVDGVSHFETIDITLESNDNAPPAVHLNTSDPTPADACIIQNYLSGSMVNGTPIPVRQQLIFMSGECEFEVGDGEQLRQKAVDVVMPHGTSGIGRCTRVIGDDPVRIAAIHFS